MVKFKPGDLVEITSKCTHEDFKTWLVFPERWPYLDVGTHGEVKEVFNNLYGTFVTVKFAGKDYYYDIKPSNLRVVEK